MPKFVPVVDNEKSQAEQKEDTDFDKHRRFDNPHKVDRGWQQGNVGWGVLGAFGSNSKDDAAQIIKRAEGSNKMIKNEKGLWVKAKELEEDIPQQQSRPGRGRGGGVSVYDEMASRTMGSADTERKNEPPRKGQYDDLGETHLKRHKQTHDSTDRGDDKREDRGRDTYSKSKRSRSRSPDRRRDERDRGDRRDDRREDRRHCDRSSRRGRSRSRSRSRSYDRHRRRDDRSDRHRDSRRSKSKSRSRSRSRSPARKEWFRRDSRDRHDKRDTERKTDRRSPPRGKPSPEHSHKDNSTHKKEALETNTAAELTAEEAALQAEMMNSITAVQVINRFHEVFSQDKLSSSQRLSQIGQVFSPGAVIASLKSGVVHITGKTGVEDSFAKTTASVPAISKRIYVEHAPDNTESATDTFTAPAAPISPKITFCLDFHRPGTAPGLGDRAKHTVLLYRCASAQITHIWGMVDHEQLSQPEELEQSVIMKSKAWALAKPLVVKDIGGFDEVRDAHFHNYDRMEVWGMF